MSNGQGHNVLTRYVTNILAYNYIYITHSKKKTPCSFWQRM